MRHYIIQDGRQNGVQADKLADIISKNWICDFFCEDKYANYIFSESARKTACNGDSFQSINYIRKKQHIGHKKLANVNNCLN